MSTAEIGRIPTPGDESRFLNIPAIYRRPHGGFKYEVRTPGDYTNGRQMRPSIARIVQDEGSAEGRGKKVRLVKKPESLLSAGPIYG